LKGSLDAPGTNITYHIFFHHRPIGILSSPTACDFAALPKLISSRSTADQQPNRQARVGQKKMWMEAPSSAEGGFLLGESFSMMISWTNGSPLKVLVTGDSRLIVRNEIGREEEP
jgi:hypothetical protein